MDIKSRVILSVVFLLSLLTLNGARRLGRFIGWFLRISNSNLYKVTMKNLSLCFPEMSEPDKEELARKSLIETGCQIAETGFAWSGSAQLRSKKIKQMKTSNEAVFEAALAKGKGVLMLTSHFGNWEFLTSTLPMKCKLMVLYKMVKMPVLEKHMLEVRCSSGLEMVPGNRQGVETFVNHYQQGHTCLIAPDQEPSEKSGVWVPYFGVNALTPKFIHSLIQSNPEGVVIFTHMKRIKDGYEMIFSEVDSGIYDADLEISAAAMNKTFERCIKVDGIEQYQWDYKRFKKNPEKHYRGL
jgi:KDO2-lipid IV(A) lauroyltransferase